MRPVLGWSIGIEGLEVLIVGIGLVEVLLGLLLNYVAGELIPDQCLDVVDNSHIGAGAIDVVALFLLLLESFYELRSWLNLVWPCPRAC